MDEEPADGRAPGVNPGYAQFRIAKALTTSEAHPDPATRERARGKVSKWLDVLRGLLGGGLAVGSRTPVAGVPGWATLEVVTGGFATGGLLAGGPLLAHERDLQARVAPDAPEADARRVLNGYFLSDAGLGELRERLRTGLFDVLVPEEGALLVVAWLVGHGHVEDARRLVETLSPYFSRLRFYPVPATRRRQFGPRVYLQDVAATIESLRNIGPNARVLAQQESVRVWAPLYDRVVALFLETVDGGMPNLSPGPDGARVARAGGPFPVEGGWPCRAYPTGWRERANAVLDEYETERARHRLSGRPDRTKDGFAQLRAYLRRCVDAPAGLSGRDVGRIRLILARYVAKRGAPDSAGCRAIRERHARDVGAPTFRDVAGVVLGRLERYPRDEGIDDLAGVVGPVDAEEEGRTTVGRGTAVPGSVRRKVERCLWDTVEVLAGRGVITSGETLARVLPQMTSGLRAAGIADGALRVVDASVYRAFRRRRSLLLLNLESQVKLEELPWVAAIERFRTDRVSKRDASRRALEALTVLTLVSFPHAIVPNKLLRELGALAKGAGVDLPLVEEVAADIFMGRFSGKFVSAARAAADVLAGTLYERYFEIDYAAVRAMPAPKEETGPGMPARPRAATAGPFAEFCAARAGLSPGGWDTVGSGMVIEQQQIVTSQNLAVLLGGLGLIEPMRGRLDGMARYCFEWVCRRQQAKAAGRHAGLVMLKNTAYAWRQMIFYLALLPPERVGAFVSWAEEHLGRQREPFRARFGPALRGLALAASGASLDDRAALEAGARRFVGWTKGTHWLTG